MPLLTTRRRLRACMINTVVDVVPIQHVSPNLPCVRIHSVCRRIADVRWPGECSYILGVVQHSFCLWICQQHGQHHVGMRVEVAQCGVRLAAQYKHNVAPDSCHGYVVYDGQRISRPKHAFVRVKVVDRCKKHVFSARQLRHTQAWSSD